jgi:hypothetical protein
VSNRKGPSVGRYSLEGGNRLVDKEWDRKRPHWFPACSRRVESVVVQVDHTLAVVPAVQHLRIGVDDCMAGCDEDQGQSY